MMMRIRIQDAAARELARLDKQVARRIVKRIRWLAANADSVRPTSLTGHLAGLRKLRVGPYRILYEIQPNAQTIVIHLIGHRKDVYRRR